VIREANLGVGDQVLIAGPFSKVRGTARQLPIVWIGNLAMMPGERIPFKDDKLIDAYLIESRSIGRYKVPSALRDGSTTLSRCHFASRFIRS
jgi:hypothetical protein